MPLIYSIKTLKLIIYIEFMHNNVGKTITIFKNGIEIESQFETRQYFLFVRHMA